MPTYKDLLVWQRSMDLAERVYDFTRTLPTQERFGLSSQLQRAAVSIPVNLAEGHGRRTRPPYLHHVSIAIGSQAEVETLLELCARMALGETDRLKTCASLARENRQDALRSVPLSRIAASITAGWYTEISPDL